MTARKPERVFCSSCSNIISNESVHESGFTNARVPKQNSSLSFKQFLQCG